MVYDKMAEVIIYQAFDPPVAMPLPLPKDSRVDAVFGSILSKLSVALFFFGVGVLLIGYTPKAIAWAENAVGAGSANYSLSSREVDYLGAVAKTQKPAYEPVFDPKLPLTNRLIIPSIGVETNIEEALYSNYEDALRKGVWRVSDFGAPGETGTPVILAAHRFGYLAWSNLYRRENSFYNLPKLSVGDTVEIDYQQRKYVYEIYAEGTGPEIADYTADLILYTCENLTGETRIFKYARLLRV